MRYECRRVSGITLCLALIALTLFSSEATAQKVRESVVYSSMTLNLVAEPNAITICDGKPAVITLKANAVSPKGSPIRYLWRATGGVVRGDGPNAVWDLSDVPNGNYKAHVEINAGDDDELCQAFASTTVLVNHCPPAPVCPRVTISCPNNPVAGQPLNFTAQLIGGSSSLPQIFNWTVSGGTITSGQGTSSINVDTSGLEGATISAALSLGGYPIDCSGKCEVQLPVPVMCKKFDEFPDLARNDEKARLDNFVIELQNDPSATGFVVVYPSQQGDVQKHAERILDYLTNSRGLSSRRIVTVTGPRRAELKIELWSCPQGAKPATPSR